MLYQLSYNHHIVDLMGFEPIVCLRITPSALLIKPIFVDPKGIEPSTLSLQGRNASHWNMRAQNVHPKPLSNEEKKMVDRLLCYSEHFCIINVRFSFFVE